MEGEEVEILQRHRGMDEGVGKQGRPDKRRRTIGMEEQTSKGQREGKRELRSDRGPGNEVKG
eukprot:910203-Pyramimonas_sp.AAC.1